MEYSNEKRNFASKKNILIRWKTKPKPQETLEYKMNKQMETFSLNPPINLSEEGEWMSAVTRFDATNSVLNTTDENKSFSVSIPGQCNSKSGEKTFDN